MIMKFKMCIMHNGVSSLIPVLYKCMKLYSQSPLMNAR